MALDRDIKFETSGKVDRNVFKVWVGTNYDEIVKVENVLNQLGYEVKYHDSYFEYNNTFVVLYGSPYDFGSKGCLFRGDTDITHYFNPLPYKQVTTTDIFIALGKIENSKEGRTSIGRYGDKGGGNAGNSAEKESDKKAAKIWDGEEFKPLDMGQSTAKGSPIKHHYVSYDDSIPDLINRLGADSKVHILNPCSGKWEDVPSSDTIDFSKLHKDEEIKLDLSIRKRITPYIYVNVEEKEPVINIKL